MRRINNSYRIHLFRLINGIYTHQFHLLIIKDFKKCGEKKKSASSEAKELNRFNNLKKHLNWFFTEGYNRIFDNSVNAPC